MQDRLTKILKVTRWISLAVCVAVIGYRVFAPPTTFEIVDFDYGSGLDQAKMSDQVLWELANELAVISQDLIANPQNRRAAVHMLHRLTADPRSLAGDKHAYLALSTAYWQLRYDEQVTGSIDAALLIGRAAGRLARTEQIARITDTEADVLGP